MLTAGLLPCFTPYCDDIWAGGAARARKNAEYVATQSVDTNFTNALAQNLEVVASQSLAGGPTRLHASPGCRAESGRPQVARTLAAQTLNSREEPRSARRAALHQPCPRSRKPMAKKKWSAFDAMDGSSTGT